MQLESIKLLRQARIKRVDQYMANNRGETPLAVLDRRIYMPFYEFERGERRPADQEVWAFRQLISETRKRNAENMGSSLRYGPLESLRSPFQSQKMTATGGRSRDLESDDSGSEELFDAKDVW